MAFLATGKGVINERFIIRLETHEDKIRVYYVNGDKVHLTHAELNDAKAFMEKVNAR